MKIGLTFIIKTARQNGLGIFCRHFYFLFFSYFSGNYRSRYYIIPRYMLQFFVIMSLNNTSLFIIFFFFFITHVFFYQINDLIKLSSLFRRFKHRIVYALYGQNNRNLYFYYNPPGPGVNCHKCSRRSEGGGGDTVQYFRQRQLQRYD